MAELSGYAAQEQVLAIENREWDVHTGLNVICYLKSIKYLSNSGPLPAHYLGMLQFLPGRLADKLLAVVSLVSPLVLPVSCALNPFKGKHPGGIVQYVSCY